MKVRLDVVLTASMFSFSGMPSRRYYEVSWDPSKEISHPVNLILWPAINNTTRRAQFLYECRSRI